MAKRMKNNDEKENDTEIELQKEIEEERKIEKEISPDEEPTITKESKEPGIKPKKKHKALKIILIILLIIIVICGAGYLVFQNYLNSKIDKIQYENITNDTVELGISEEQSTSKYRNIALLGVDSRYDTYDADYRTDCIMIASINKETNAVNLFSIYRDTFVEMEEDGETKLDKINHAYYGGVENTLKTINKNFDLNITEYVTVDFNAVADLVDKVGGVDINVDSSELKWINSYINDVSNVTGIESEKLTKTGTLHLDGVQATAYGRIRYTAGSDYKRAERMREVLNEIVKNIKKKAIPEINELVDFILPEMHTNISNSEVKTMIPQALSLSFNKTFGFPYNTKDIALNKNDYSAKATGNNIDYYCAPRTLASNVEKLHKEVFGEEDYILPEEVQRISDDIVKTTGVK